MNDDKKTSKQPEIIQLEPTSKCNLSCTTCLKGQPEFTWIERELDFSILTRLAAQNSSLKAVHLQGWGEPLLYTKLFQAITYLKDKNITTSFTTNGTRLDKKLADKICKSGIDSVTFSMAGGSSQVHDPLRGVGSYKKLITGTNNLLQARLKSNHQALKIAISYLLTPQTVKELPKVIRWCRKNKIDKLATVHLTQAASDTQANLQYLHLHKPFRVKLHRAWMNALAISGKFDFTLRSYAPSLTPVCDKYPGQSLFISAAGEVSPCVFLNPPIEKGIVWQKDCQNSFQEPVIFGSLHHSSLQEIIDTDGYKEFMQPFEKRLEFYQQTLAKVGYSMEGAEQLELAVKKISRMFAATPVPSPCQLCRKIDGF